MILFQKKVVPINPKVGQSDVDAYLSEVREAIAEKRCTFHSNKTKNRETLSGLGLTLSDVYEEISTPTSIIVMALCLTIVPTMQTKVSGYLRKK